MQTFHFGIVLYNTPTGDVNRLCSSIKIACEIAGVPYNITLLFNSNDEQRFSIENTMELKKIPFTENLGFGRAHNNIIQLIENNEDYYVGLNPDGFLYPWSMQAALRWLKDPQALYEFLQFPQELPKSYDAPTGDVPWCSCAAFIIQAGYFRQLGGFDDRFFMYCEDVDLSWRVREADGRCICMGDALFFHDVSDRRASVHTIRSVLTSQVLLAHKWGNRWARRWITWQLKRVCRRSNLPMPDLSGYDRHISTTRTPSFCDFRRDGNFGEARW